MSAAIYFHHCNTLDKCVPILREIIAWLHQLHIVPRPRTGCSAGQTVLMQSASNKALILIELFSKLEVLYQRPRSVFCFTFSPEKFPFPIFRANANKFRLIGLVMISHRFGGGSEQQQAGAAGTPPPVPPPVLRPAAGRHQILYYLHSSRGTVSHSDLY